MNLSEHLTRLEQAQLVRQVDENFMAYIFKHVLVQETTYASLLKHDRQRLHRVVASTLVLAESERLNENAARLAQHFSEAGDDAKTLEYALLAGEFASAKFANAEAIEQYSLAIQVLKRRGGSAQEYLAAYMPRGRALELVGEFEGALENYLELEEIGMRNGDPSLELQGLLERATIYATPTNVHDTRQGAVLNARALELARTLGDRRAECKTLWNLLLISYFDVDPVSAVEYGERALVLARELGLEEREAYILNDISRPLISIGPIARSIASLDAARELFQAQNNLPMLADNLAATAETLMFAGDYARGLEFSQRAVELSRTLNSHWNLAYAGFGLMPVNLEQGNLDRVFAWHRELSALPGAKGSVLFLFASRAWVAEAYHVLGDFEQALELNRRMVEWAVGSYPLALGWLRANVVRDLVALGELEEAQQELERAYQGKLADYSGMAPILVPAAAIELAIAQGDADRAIRVALEMLENLERRDIAFLRAGIYHLLGKAYALQRAWEDARTAFENAERFGTDLPMRRTLWQTYAAWAAVETQRGNAARARGLRALALEHIHTIADHAGSARNRELFLGQPAVKAVMNDSREPMPS